MRPVRVAVLLAAVAFAAPAYYHFVHFDGGVWSEQFSTTLASIIGVWGADDGSVVDR